MPIIRKIRKTGDSQGITLPKSWLDYIERETGHRPTEVALEVDGTIIVTPIIKEASEFKLT
jgi:antitoxin component of MazEF toxin-antitoxin module